MSRAVGAGVLAIALISIVLLGPIAQPAEADSVAGSRTSGSGPFAIAVNPATLVVDDCDRPDHRCIAAFEAPT